MSENERLPDFLVLPGEVEVGKRLFDDKPVRAIKKFLECFDEDGRQVFITVPGGSGRSMVKIFTLSRPRPPSLTNFCTMFGRSPSAAAQVLG